mmetsp:Transcript_44518/g.125738  ORF Transcript_44518/g.125738 Transcript_44518/m.125738 type:complete len:120 (-) Transcript_44518:78-437(-)
MWILVLALLLLALLVLLLRLRAASSNQRAAGGRARCLVVLGSGGHTTEMLYDLRSLGKLLERLELTYLIADTDRGSLAQVEARSESPHTRSGGAGDRNNLPADLKSDKSMTSDRTSPRT